MHAATIERDGRSPLYVELMRGAAGSASSGGVVARLFEGGPLDRGSVPSLRLMAALHALVLEGAAGELAAFYPSAGGTREPPGAWAAAERVLEERFGDVRARIGRTVQTNEPGRCAASFGALLALSERFGLPIRLLEIGASGGLCLIPDRYGYVVDGERLGAPVAALVFEEPWVGSPVADPPAATDRMRISSRAGCDLAPLDLSTEGGRLTARSYIWPDEPDRLDRLGSALETFTRDPVAIETASADDWCRRVLRALPDGVTTVIWQSVVRQYLPEAVKRRLEDVIEAAGERARVDAPLALVSMEPGEDHLGDFSLTCTTWPSGETTDLGIAGNHGPPVRWSARDLAG